MVPTRFPQAVAVVLGLLLLCAAPMQAADVAAASAHAHGWLLSQQRASGLVDSYKDKADTCYTYDQAVATIAFIARGDTAAAGRVLEALAGLQNSDGSWYHAYTCTNGGVLSRSRYVGAVSWVALAMAHFQDATGDVTYQNSAERALNWAVDYIQADGGINGGVDSSGVPIRWASTEHNQDAYAALGYFGYPQQADVRTFLDNVVYNVAQQRWNQGRNDPLNPLDVNPLGVLALGPTGAHQYWRSLDYSQINHRSLQTLKRGRVRLSVDGFDFNADRNDIWFEGTAQMALALRLAGRAGDGAYFLQEMIKAQQKDGGIPYSLKGTNNGDFTMSTATSVAGTGWFVLAAENLNPMQPGL